MNKSELVDAIAKKSGLPKTTSATILDSTLVIIQETLAEGGEISLTGWFGRFYVKGTAPKTN